MNSKDKLKSQPPDLSSSIKEIFLNPDQEDEFKYLGQNDIKLLNGGEILSPELEQQSLQLQKTISLPAPRIIQQQQQQTDEELIMHNS